MKTRVLLLVLVVVAALSAAVAGARAAEPPSPGTPDPGALCPRLMPIDDDCYSIPLPSEGWLLGSVIDVDTTDRRAVALYDALLAEHAKGFGAPAKRQIAVLQFRLNVPGTPGTLEPRNPGPGYGEASIALRVSFDGEEGFPYSDGWFPLAQPVNDPSQYGAGRDVGIPKYMADIAMTHDAKGWHGVTENFGGRDQAGGPGIATVAGGSSMRLDWAPSSARPANAEQVLAWTRMEQPLFTEKRPYDERGVEHHPAMVKFTPVAWLTNDESVPENPVTSRPPKLGRMRVTLRGDLPVTPAAFADARGRAARWSDLFGTRSTFAAPGAFWHAKGYTVITGDDLTDNGAEG